MIPAPSYRRSGIEQELSPQELVQLLNVWKHRYAFETRRSFTDSPATPPWTVVLGLSEQATAQEIRQAYRRKVKDRHPDHGGSAEAFMQLQTAYNQAMSNQHYINTLAK
jgi:DnaJ domain